MPVPMSTKQKVLVWLLRIFGASAALATVAVFLPTASMARIHAWLGLGVFPEAPIVDYLSRQLSLFYALVGGILLVAASDVERYRTLILYIGWASLVAGIAILGIDMHAGIPLWWTLHEGPAASVFGLALVWLVRSSVPEG